MWDLVLQTSEALSSIADIVGVMEAEDLHPCVDAVSGYFLVEGLEGMTPIEVGRLLLKSGVSGAAAMRVKNALIAQACAPF